MTIQTEIYRPDTCSCVIQVKFDDTQVNPTFSLDQYIFKDTPHAQLTDNLAFNIVKLENTTKNGAFEIIASTTMSENTIQAPIDFNSSGYTFNFQFSGTCTLASGLQRPMNCWTTSASGVAALDGGTLQTAINNNGLSGLVFVVSGSM